jgi:PadR family transcriptional regulator PadR
MPAKAPGRRPEPCAALDNPPDLATVFRRVVRLAERDVSPWETQLRKGLAELAVLAVIAREEAYGYRIVERLQGLDGLALSESTVYPILTRLAREGLLAVRTEASPAGPTRRYYRLTNEGQRRLCDLAGSWSRVSGSLTVMLEGVLP